MSDADSISLLRRADALLTVAGAMSECAPEKFGTDQFRDLVREWIRDNPYRARPEDYRKE